MVAEKKSVIPRHFRIRYPERGRRDLERLRAAGVDWRHQCPLLTERTDWSASRPLVCSPAGPFRLVVQPGGSHFVIPPGNSAW